MITHKCSQQQTKLGTGPSWSCCTNPTRKTNKVEVSLTIRLVVGEHEAVVAVRHELGRPTELDELLHRLTVVAPMTEEGVVGVGWPVPPELAPAVRGPAAIAIEEECMGVVDEHPEAPRQQAGLHHALVLVDANFRCQRVHAPAVLRGKRAVEVAAIG